MENEIPESFKKFIKEWWREGGPSARYLYRRFGSINEAVKGMWEVEDQKERWYGGRFEG